MLLKPPFQKPQITIKDLVLQIISPVDAASFNSALQEYWGMQNIYLTKTARQALWLILSSIKPEPGSEVIVSSFTPVVVPLAAMKAGCQPVFCDVIQDGFVMSPEDAEKKVTKKTIAIVMPYSFGCFSDIEKFTALARKHNLILIEDCAQTLKGKYKDKYIGFNADFGIWSFGISKNIGSLNGGAFWYHDRHKKGVEKAMAKFLLNNKPKHNIFDHFRASGVPFINTRFGYWLLRPIIDYYQRGRETSRSIGYDTAEFDSALTNFEAALCHRQLNRYDHVYQRRKMNYQIYENELKNLVKFPSQPFEFEPDYLYAPILVEQQVRARLLNQFQNTLVSDINFAYINELDVLKGISFNTPNRLRVQDEYLLLTLHHSDKLTRKIARQLKLAIIKFSK